MHRRNRTLWPVSSAVFWTMPLMPILTPLALVDWNFNPIKNPDTWITYGFMYLQSLTLSYGIRIGIAYFTPRHRPQYYFDPVDTPQGANSFPSGHTSVVFMPATFLSVTFAQEFPDSKLKYPIIIGSHALAAFVGAVRIYNGMHFLTDVIAGAAIGSFCGWIFPFLHKVNKQNDNLSFHFIGNGFITQVRMNNL